jgi:hypothetical protein
MNPEWPFSKAVINYFEKIDGESLSGGEKFIVEGIPLISHVGNEPFGMPFEKTLYIDVDHNLGKNLPPPACGLVTLLIWSIHRKETRLTGAPSGPLGRDSMAFADKMLESLDELRKYANGEYKEADLSDNEREMRIHLEYENRIWGIMRTFTQAEAGK